MKTEQVKYDIATGYQDFEPFLLNIQKKMAEDGGQTIHKARNELKVLRYQDKDIVVKSFKVPNLLNQYVYGNYRDSKAKRSFDYSIQLRALGISCPKPIGYIEFRQGKKLQQSYYLSEKVDYDFIIRPVLEDKDWAERESVLTAVAEFAYRMHQHGAYHLDYSPGNILVKKLDDEYQLTICDVNRMQFSAISFQQGLSNFVRLIRDKQTLTIFARVYAELDGQDPEQAINWLTESRNNYLAKRQRLNKIKSIFR